MCAVSHHQCTTALVRTKCIPHCPEFLCKTGCQQACVTANRPLGNCSSSRCAVTQSLSALQHWSGQNAYLTTQSCSAKQAVNIFLSLQIDLWVFALHIGVQCPSSVHCSIVQDKMHFSLPCAALQNRLTACWCHCNYTFGQFFNVQVFNVSSPTALQHL